ncbi:TOBE domain-containing protein [Crenobacter cavernae]|uniref:TOBE domain-containing protein n=1 Tax=Crenobacter cavernae TaxID=2290923 RepID=UPI001FE39968|nr:TOBE domain-containing protein [Crenobacter cavernae]
MSDDVVEVGSHTLQLGQPLPEGDAFTLFLRPEDILIRAQWEPAANTVLARVADVAFAGALTRLKLSPEGMPGVTLTADLCPSMLSRQPIVPGEIVPIALPAARLIAYPEGAPC